ncbi:MAG: putative tRNA sulfurtransferase [Candidatus Parcubacteria bacterium]|nr:MAG: putative tRNA sulfurtransferase [Candidatus Parcubacteria bacterium]
MDFLLTTEEIILKGKNRKFFERILVENIRKKLGSDLVFIKNLGGRYWVKIASNHMEFGVKLTKIFGIKSFYPVKVFDSLEELLNNLFVSVNSAPSASASDISVDGKTFKIEVQRGDKDYPLTSIEIAKKVNEFIKNKFNLQVDFKNPELTIYIYYKDKKFFLAYERVECFGGLPVGSSGKGLVLLSAGFDSPVASFLAMKRGLKVYFLHFHSYPQTSKESLEKVKKLVAILNEYNLGSKLYLMNILELQKFYYNNIPHKFLVIFYRRSMFRLAEKLVQELNLDCLITGESLVQVASQTIENLKVISYGVNNFVFRPLLGFNKSEIIDLARKIGTHSISLLKGDDCCSLFVPKKVETRAKLKEILEIEAKFKKEIEELEEKIFSGKELLK